MNHLATGFSPLMGSACPKSAAIPSIDRRLYETAAQLEQLGLPWPDQIGDVQKYELLSLLRAQLRAKEYQA